jgi:C4-dicarboxylate-specific signal transduction histidine kinase
MKAEKKITILVNPPWWKTWWAYSSYILIAGLLLFVVYRSQKQRIIRKEREKTQLFELEQAKEIEKAYHELRTTQAQLVQSEKMASLGELTAGIAHEIQNPLNFVNNFSEVNIELTDELKTELNKTGLSPEEKKNLANYVDDIAQNQAKINEHGHRADAIVKSMLQHSRNSTGQKS